MSRFQQIIVPKRRLADEVYAQILSAITEGAIPPSERIVQEKLAADFQISRTPVREALLRLEQEGILITVGSGGFMPHPLAGNGTVDLIGNPIKLSKTPVTYRRPPPVCGADTKSVLDELLKQPAAGEPPASR